MSQTDSTAVVPWKQDDLRKAYKAAKAMVGLGWQLFPLHRIDWTEPPSCPCGAPDCDRVGKHPMFMWKEERVTDTAGAMKEWFDHVYRGIGLVTGHASGVWVLDIDTKGDGHKTLEELEAKNGKLPHTVTAFTGSGGKHYFFKYPGPEYRNTARRLGPGLDSRGDGGYAVVPPTMHKSGREYAWENSPFNTPLAEAPAWLLELAKSSHDPATHPNVAVVPSGDSYVRCTEDEALERVKLVTEHPLFVWASENPESVLWEMWRGMAQNLAAVTEGYESALEAAEEAFQQMSEGHPGYSRDKAGKVFREAAKRVLVEIPKEGRGGPITFARMLEQGNVPGELIQLDDGVNLATAARRKHREQQWASGKKDEAGVTTEEVSAPAAKASAPPAPAPKPSAPPPPAQLEPSTPPLNLGNWDSKEATRFFYDECRQAYRYIKDPTDPLSLSGALNTQSITQILTSDYRMPKKSAARVMESFRILDRETLDPAYPPGPSRVRGPTPQSSSRYAFNYYRPLHVTPRPGTWHNIRALLTLLVGGDQKALEWYLDWLAKPLQALIKLKKLIKLRTAVAFSGLPGAGKGTMEAVIRILYGDMYVATISQDILDSPYQAELVNKLFVVADEVQAHDKAAVARLKRLVTAKEIEINQKYVARTVAPNFAQYIFTTNDDVPVRVEKGDRRFSVFFTQKPDPSITDAVWADIKGPQDECAAFLDFLLNRTITHNLERPFENEARENVQTNSLKIYQSFVKEVRENGLHAVASPWKDGEKMSRPRQVTITPDTNHVSSMVLVEIYQAWAKTYGGRAFIGTPSIIIAQLKKEGLIGEPKRRTINGERMSYYDNIPLHAFDDGAPDDPVPPQSAAVVKLTPEVKPDDIPFGAS